MVKERRDTEKSVGIDYEKREKRMERARQELVQSISKKKKFL